MATAGAEAYVRFFHAMLEPVIYLPRFQFEAMFLSLTHPPQNVGLVVELAVGALRH